MHTKVIIIDDDKFQMGHYKRALSAANFAPILVPTTSGVMPIVSGKAHRDASFFIVDMMMPPGDLYSDEATECGAYTGLFISRDLRNRFPVTPILLWTSAHLDSIRAAGKRHAATISNCRYAAKASVSPDDLVCELSYWLKKGRFRPRLLKVLWRAVGLGTRALAVAADVKGIRS
jgi:hypothetical protein